MSLEEDKYWERVREAAKEIQSDGCSGVPDFYIDCCYEHDWHYRKRVTLDGKPITRAQADAKLRECHQRKSRFGKCSPMSWWRWGMLRLVGGRAWKNNLKKYPDGKGDVDVRS